MYESPSLCQSCSQDLSALQDAISKVMKWDLMVLNYDKNNQISRQHGEFNVNACFYCE
jgi:phosphoribosyl-dephospho-CoA transferase